MIKKVRQAYNSKGGREKWTVIVYYIQNGIVNIILCLHRNLEEQVKKP